MRFSVFQTTRLHAGVCSAKPEHIWFLAAFNEIRGERERERDRDRDRQTETDRQRDRDRQTGTDRDRRTDTDRQKQADREKSKTLFYEDCSLASV